MDELNVQALLGFGVTARRVVKARAGYTCYADKGCFWVQKNFDTPSAIWFRHDVKEHAAAAGVPVADRFCLSVTGDPYVRLGGALYTMSVLCPYKDASFADSGQLMGAVSVAAAFHKAARSITFTEKVEMADFNPEAPSPDLFLKNLQELHYMKKKVAAGKRLSDFDVLFIKHYDFYARQIETAAALLAESGFTALNAQAVAERAVCHGALKEENMPTDGETVYLSNFSKASPGHFLTDLAALIIRYAKRLPGAAVPLRDITARYAETFPLSIESRRALYPLLLYPDKFVRICRQYYSKKRTWTPIALTSRMEAALAGREGYYGYILEAGKY